MGRDKIVERILPSSFFLDPNGADAIVKLDPSEETQILVQIVPDATGADAIVRLDPSEDTQIHVQIVPDASGS